ncbi:MAG: hypothetical protein ACM3JB_18010 [Acidobacteriaceae bacterium]
MYACIFIPDFMVEAVLRAEPMLRGQAVAVLEGKPPLCYIVGANETARRLGVEIGMTKLLAQTLNTTEQPKIGGTEGQPKNRRSDQPKNNKQQRRIEIYEERRTNSEERGARNEERGTKNEERSRRPHAQGAYEATYGQMNPRFGLYRTRLDPDELDANCEPPATSEDEAVLPKNEERTTKNLLSPKNEELILRYRSAAQEQSAHAALLDAAHAVSPRVEDSAPDTVLLDVHGLDRLFGIPQQVAQELVKRITEVGLVANVAIAANPDAAEHAARGYNGVTIVPAGHEGKRLGTLPLEILFSAARSAALREIRHREDQRKATERFTDMQETLDRWGIRNFRGLAALPAVSLSERLGTDGARLQALASGAATRELVLNEAALRFEEAIELEYPVDVLESLAFLLSRMLDGLCGRLAARALATNELRLRMRLEYRTADEAAKSKEELEGDPVAERKIALPVPMNDARLFLKLLQLELSAKPPGAPVTQLWLEAEPARPRFGQAGLFQPLAPEAQKLELTLARLHKLLGVREQIRAGCAELVDTHQPDRFVVKRFQCERENGKPAKRQNENRQFFVPRSSSKFSIPGSQFSEKGNGEASCSQHDSQHREGTAGLSLRRFRPPLPVTIELRDGIPVRVSSAELGARDPLHDNVVWAAGPWRSSGNWWERNGKTAKPQNGKRENLPGEANSEERANNEKRRTSNEERTTTNEERTENWNTEEWDIALALTRRGGTRRERATEIALYRLVRDCVAERWSVEAIYD